MTLPADTSPHTAMQGVWPPSELEHLGHCPICRSTERQVLHDQLADHLFRSAPGLWTLHACQNCHCAYLDPRPSPQSIGRAYQQYFTHASSSPSVESLGPQQSLRQRIRQWLRAGLNGYHNARWGMELTPSNPWGPWWVPCLPPLHSLLLTQMRHLPRRPPTAHARLLDVGCGNGAFLHKARAAGWDVQGIDFDPVAVDVTRRQGLAVHCGGLEQVAHTQEHFDWITCSHVIEHVHDPLAWLQGMHKLLRPHGTLWLQTPNIQSLGHSRFGIDWRGLEPPRHLTIFTPRTLCQVLKEAGFTPQLYRLPALSAASVLAASEALHHGHDALTPQPLGRLLRFRYLLPAAWQALSRQRAEFITIAATRNP